ncbi:hypothetical protein IJ472_07430 [bacterium]|nr:hypothetical protein [bacterium]
MSIGSIASKIRTNAGKYLVKGVGIAALGLVAYDSHYVGKIQADKYATEKDAKAAAYFLNNMQYANDLSPVRGKIKKTAYEMELDQGWRRFFNLGIGYIKGFCSMLVSNVVPLGLGLATVLGKGKTSKFGAIGLGIYAVGSIIKNAFGIGVPRGPLK